jgi:hypothetical protein
MMSVLRPSKIRIHFSLKNKPSSTTKISRPRWPGRKGFGRRLSPIAWTQEEVRKPSKKNRIKPKEQVQSHHHPRRAIQAKQNQAQTPSAKPPPPKRKRKRTVFWAVRFVAPKVQGGEDFRSSFDQHLGISGFS